MWAYWSASAPVKKRESVVLNRWSDRSLAAVRGGGARYCQDGHFRSGPVTFDCLPQEVTLRGEESSDPLNV